jgi:hypothetical protein
MKTSLDGLRETKPNKHPLFGLLTLQVSGLTTPRLTTSSPGYKANNASAVDSANNSDDSGTEIWHRKGNDVYLMRSGIHTVWAKQVAGVMEIQLFNDTFHHIT